MYTPIWRWDILYYIPAFTRQNTIFVCHTYCVTLTQNSIYFLSNDIGFRKIENKIVQPGEPKDFE